MQGQEVRAKHLTSLLGDLDVDCLDNSVSAWKLYEIFNNLDRWDAYATNNCTLHGKRNNGTVKFIELYTYHSMNFLNSILVSEKLLK